MKKNVSLVWFRQDLRLADNPALRAGCERGAVVPVYFWAPEEEGKWPPGAASRWWLHQSLAKLDGALRERGSRLIIRRGPTLKALQSVMEETGADKVFWNRRYEPASIERDKSIKSALPAESFNSALLFEPWEIETGSGGPYRVFTPFWRACVSRQSQITTPVGAPVRLEGLSRWPDSLSVNELELEPKIDWAGGLRRAWRPGEAGAVAELRRFVRSGLDGYDTGRDRPDRVGTSRLSPYLHFGEIGPRQIWEAVQKRPNARSAWAFLRELGWREFAYHLLYHYPHTTEKPLREEFARFAWREDAAALKAWQRGRTGLALVDAGMRELWATGWMHNRVRMMVASFLVKDLMARWQEGTRWFWDTLVDADLANNTLGWQWTAGCGADAAPFFRIFNPETQASKFDPDEKYIRRWVPEYGTADYPKPIVDHKAARERALEAYQRIR
jgi:deoxyribodipyrimidine photo-lyase